MEYQKKSGQKLWMVLDFVKNGTLMSLYRDISEVRNKAGLYNEFYYGKENKKNTFTEIVDLLEEQDFPENWFETKFDRMGEVIENIVELLEVDEEQFELYVRSFENQVWFKAKKVEVKVESESDSDEEEDSGAGAVEDSDDESEDDEEEWQCHYCGEDYPSEIEECPVCSGDKFRCETCYKVCDWEVKVEPDEDENADDEVCYDCYMKSVDDKDEEDKPVRLFVGEWGKAPESEEE